MEITLIHYDGGRKHEASCRYQHNKWHSYVYRDKIDGFPYGLPRRRCRKAADDPKKVIRALEQIIKAQKIFLECARPAKAGFPAS